MCIYMCVYICVGVCVFVGVYVCIYIAVNIKIDIYATCTTSAFCVLQHPSKGGGRHRGAHTMNP